MPTTTLEKKTKKDQFHGICHFINCRDNCQECRNNLSMQEKTKYAKEGQKKLQLLEIGGGERTHEVFVEIETGCSVWGGVSSCGNYHRILIIIKNQKKNFRTAQKTL